MQWKGKLPIIFGRTSIGRHLVRRYKGQFDLFEAKMKSMFGVFSGRWVKIERALMKAARWAGRRLDVTWPYRAEKERMREAESAGDPDHWVGSPLAAAAYSFGWQIAVVAGAVGSSFFWWRSRWEMREELFFVLLGIALCCMFIGGVAEMWILPRAVRNRRWGLAVGFQPVSILRALDYAFGPRGEKQIRRHDNRNTRSGGRRS